MSQDTNRANSKPPHLDRLSLLCGASTTARSCNGSVAYVALAYGIQHGVVPDREAFLWPHMIQEISMLVLAFGVPVVMTFAWYHGERASRRIVGTRAAAAMTIISLLLVMSSLLFYVFVRLRRTSLRHRRCARRTRRGPTRGGRSARRHFPSRCAVYESSRRTRNRNSSRRHDRRPRHRARQDSRSSRGRARIRFQYRGEKNDMRAVGQALNATHLIEARYASGDRVRVTAQLSRPTTASISGPTRMIARWTDVFAIQEDIARAIATSLRMPLGIKPGENLVANRNIDVELYQQFLRCAPSCARSQGSRHESRWFRNSKNWLPAILGSRPSGLRCRSSISRSSFPSNLPFGRGQRRKRAGCGSPPSKRPEGRSRGHPLGPRFWHRPIRALQLVKRIGSTGPRRKTCHRKALDLIPTNPDVLDNLWIFFAFVPVA